MESGQTPSPEGSKSRRAHAPTAAMADTNPNVPVFLSVISVLSQQSVLAGVQPPPGHAIILALLRHHPSTSPTATVTVLEEWAGARKVGSVAMGGTRNALGLSLYFAAGVEE